MTPIPNEKITFYCSALEALLSTSQSELSHQIAERVAVLCSKELAERVEIYKFIKGSYSFRSKYIHGSPIRDNEEDAVIKMSVKLDHIVRRTIEIAIADAVLMEALADEKKLDDFMLLKILE